MIHLPAWGLGRALRWAAAVAAAAAFLAAAQVQAQVDEGPPARALTGALKRIKESGVVRIGYREAAVPFAFTGRDGHPRGYSIDLCQALVADIEEAAGASSLAIEYRRVTVADRIEQVADGRVDLECGATTSTAERRQRVAFSPLIFVAGTRLVVKRSSPIRSERNLAGRKVAVARATTNEAVMRQLASRPGRVFELVVAEDFAQAFEKLATGTVDALAADDVLIAGFLAEKDPRGRFAMVGAPLSHEPYGIMFAKGDKPFAEVVEAGLRRLATTREIRWIYDQWFQRPLPSGIRLGLPMSAPLQRSFELLGMPSE